MGSKGFYKKRGIATILTALFSLGLIAILAIFLFFPALNMVGGSEDITMNGLEVLQYGVYRLEPSLHLDKFDTFNAYFVGYSSDNIFLQYFAQYRYLVTFVIAVIFALAFVFGLFILISALIWLIAGKKKHPKTTSVLAVIIFAFFALATVLLFIYVFIYQGIIVSLGGSEQISVSFYLWLYLGAMLALIIVLSIIWQLAFKNRTVYKEEPVAQE